MHVYQVPSWIQRLLPKAIWRLPQEVPTVFLTFDDGPHPSITPWVLDQLHAHQSKAHFFVVGRNAQQHPALCDQIVRQGHGLGSHTFEHRNGWKTDFATYCQEIRKGHQSHTKMGPYFRPPHGRIRRRQAQWLLQNGYRWTMWDLLSGDYNASLKPQDILDHLKRKTRNGSLVVFHDSEKAELRLRAILPPYLAWLQQKGFCCSPLPALNA